jgi:hypothetical protein
VVDRAMRPAAWRTDAGPLRKRVMRRSISLGRPLLREAGVRADLGTRALGG